MVIDYRCTRRLIAAGIDQERQATVYIAEMRFTEERETVWKY